MNILKKTTAMIVATAVSTLLLTGCATNLRKPEGQPQPAKTKLSTFATVGIKPVTINPKFAGAAANEKARKKIDEHLSAKLKMCFSSAKVEILDAKNPAKTALVVEPNIEEIKFIGGGARFWLGAMAGSSAVLIKVKFVTAAGEVLSEPEFYRAGNSMQGAWSMGASDNMMLEEIAQDVAMYTKLNM